MPKAVLGIRPTRVELLKLRRRELVAQKGHDILEEKLEALLIRNQQASADLAESVGNIRDNFVVAYGSLKKAGMISGFRNLNEISYAVREISPFTGEIIRIAGVRVPKCDFNQDDENNCPGYGYLGTNGLVDETASTFKHLLSDLVSHAELEGTVRALNQEINSTRRRVNALEQIIIPDLIRSRQYIEMRLEEREREDLFRRKRTKKLLENKKT